MRVSSGAGLALLGLLLFGGAAAAGAQRVDPKRIIDFHVNAEQQNVSFGGAVVEGGRFRMNIARRGMYALGVVQVSARPTFAVTVFRGEGSPEDPTYTAIETVRASLHAPTRLTSLPYFTVIIDGTRAAETAASRVPVSNFSLAAYVRHMTTFDDRCCVTCGGIEACACAVTASCGSCCVNPCCKPPDDPGGVSNTAPRFFPPPVKFADAVGRRCNSVPDAERVYPEFRPTSGAIASR